MSFFIGILTFFLVVNCAVLILLVLVQLPKKDAGAGLAFGGGAADALFGAGSGNALTKITKYATGLFFVLALGIGFLQDRAHNPSTSTFENQLKLDQSHAEMPSTSPSPTTPAAAPKSSLLALPLPTDSNAPASPAPAK
jgi:preprotein translocase subunit SecG